MAGLALATIVVPSTRAASITAELTCSLNILGTSCDNIGPFGTVAIEDVGNDVRITVDLLNPNLKFRDLMVAFGGTATTIGSDDAQAVELAFDFFTISPYIGAFDIGNKDDQGWVGDSGYSAVLSGDAVLSVGDFLNAFDTLNKVSVALHIQNIGASAGEDCDGADDPHPCVPGMEGPGSLKIGGVFEPDEELPEIPEPSTMLLMGAGLLGFGYWRKRRNS